MSSRFLFLRLLFVGLMLYPTLTQYVHIFEHHDHPTCDEITLHFHEGDTSCQLLDYVSNTQALLPLFSSFSPLDFFHFEKTVHPTAEYSKSIFSKHKRGPPAV